jgi:ketosteroid isomerase-like protein
MQKASTETSRAAVANFCPALRAGDMDALRAAFTPDATWILRGSLPASGTWTTHARTRDGRGESR